MRTIIDEVRYPIPFEQLHKKDLGKNTLNDVIVKGIFCTDSYSGGFYHYTSPEGLKGILSSRTLFFTDCQFLNDYNERININDDLEEFWWKNGKYYDEKFMTLLNDIRINEYEDYGFSHMESDEVDGMPSTLTRYFVLSTSFEKDSLNMWKYYAKNGSYDGYCIRLEKYALSDEWDYRKTGVAVSDGKVLYYSDEKQEAIRNAVDKLYDIWCEYKVCLSLNQKIIDDYKSWISVASLFFKNECFFGEYEYRFIAAVPVNKLRYLTYDRNGSAQKMYDFRLSNGVLTPYIKMPFNLFMKDECWDIRSIGISPALNNTQKELGLKMFLQSLDYDLAKCDIYHSNIPLRY